MRKTVDGLRSWFALKTAAVRRRRGEGIHLRDAQVAPMVERTMDGLGMIGLIGLGLMAAIAFFLGPYHG